MRNVEHEQNISAVFPTCIKQGIVSLPHVILEEASGVETTCDIIYYITNILTIAFF